MTGGTVGEEGKHEDLMSAGNEYAQAYNDYIAHKTKDERKLLDAPKDHKIPERSLLFDQEYGKLNYYPPLLIFVSCIFTLCHIYYFF